MHNQTTDEPLIRYFNIYINLFYLIFGNLGNLLKIAFFLQKPLRSLPCTIYILFSTCSDFITLNNLPILQLLIHCYPKYHWIKVTVDWSNYRNETILLSYSTTTYDIIMCKTRSYLHLFSTDLSFQMLLFASINRFCSTYRRKQRSNNIPCFHRYFCNYPDAYRLCIITCIISALLSLQHVFNFTIYSPSQGCVPYNRILCALWISTIQCFLLPILMIIFGVLTLRTVRSIPVLRNHIECSHLHHQIRQHQYIETCVHCSRCQKSLQHKIDRQLTSMILSEIVVTVLTSFPYGIYAFYYLLHGIQDRTIDETNRTKWITLFIRLTMYFEPSCGFYIYLLTLSTLRKRFNQTILKRITRMDFYCRNK